MNSAAMCDIQVCMLIKKIVGFLITLFSVAFAALRFVADWVGRSTVGDDTQVLYARLMYLFKFIPEDSSLIFYTVSFCIALLGVATFYSEEIKAYFQSRSQSALPSTKIPVHNPETPYNSSGINVKVVGNKNKIGNIGNR